MVKIPKNRQLARSACYSTIVFLSFVACVTPAIAKDAALRERLAQIKLASAANKKALSRYTWQESVTTSIKGEVKKQQIFQVRVGPAAEQQKSPIDGKPDA